MENFHFISNIRKYIFKKAIIKVAFVETGFYPFNLKKVFNKLLLPHKATLEKDIILAINIITLKTIR